MGVAQIHIPILTSPAYSRPYSLLGTILAGFVLQSVEDEHLNCVSAGVGMKCLPASRIPLHGDVGVHDTQTNEI